MIFIVISYFLISSIFNIKMHFATKLQKMVEISQLILQSVSLHVGFQVPLLLTPINELIDLCIINYGFILNVCVYISKVGFKLSPV